MIPRYILLAQRIRTELQSLEKVVQRAKRASQRASEQVQDKDFFISSAAFDLHSFYVGTERIFELIASDVDQNRPSGPQWHRDLLAQMMLSVPAVRPAVLTPETGSALQDFLEFRHVVRNVYTFNLRTDRIAELVEELQMALEMSRNDLLAFADFLDDLSRADQDTD